MLDLGIPEKIRNPYSNKSKDVKAEPNTAAEILNTLNQVLEAYSQGKLDEMMHLFAPDPDVTLIGIGAENRCVGLENIRSHLKETFDHTAPIVSAELEDPIISEHGGVAWISTGVKVQFEVAGESVNIYYRNTTTLIKQNEKWLIAQMHNSSPLGGPE